MSNIDRRKVVLDELREHGLIAPTLDFDQEIRDRAVEAVFEALVQKAKLVQKANKLNSFVGATEREVFLDVSRLAADAILQLKVYQ